MFQEHVDQIGGKWWAVILASFAIGVGLALFGFARFQRESFLENFIAEAVGLAFSMSAIIWLVEGPVLTKQSRLDKILEYKEKAFQVFWSTAHILAREMAQPIAGDFEPAIDLYGRERGRWSRFEPLLRQTFESAQAVEEGDVWRLQGMDEASALRYASEILDTVERTQESIGEAGEFDQWYVLGKFSEILDELLGETEQAVEEEHFAEPIQRYRTMGQLGENLLDAIASLGSSSDSVTYF